MSEIVLSLEGPKTLGELVASTLVVTSTITASRPGEPDGRESVRNLATRNLYSAALLSAHWERMLQRTGQPLPGQDSISDKLLSLLNCLININWAFTEITHTQRADLEQEARRSVAR